jgi:hypothetical protein
MPWVPGCPYRRTKRWGPRRSWLSALVGVLASVFLAGAARALPEGRAWTEIDTTTIPGHTRLYPDRLEVDSLGSPMLVAEGAGGIGYDKHVLAWQDTSWVLRGSLGQSVAYAHPVTTMGPGLPLIWQTFDELYLPGLNYVSSYLVMADFDGTAFVHIDTVSIVSAMNFGYAGTVSQRRRWAIKHDYTNGVRLWYSDTLHVWHGMTLPGLGNYGVAVSALDDTTALVAWSTWYPGTLHWGRVQGAAWEDGGDVPGPVPLGSALFTRFRRSSDGTQWLGWSTDDHYVQVASYHDGSWTPAESLHCDMPYAGQFVSRAIGVSRDGWPRPTVAWIEHNVDAGFVGTMCVCVPSDSGYPEGEHVPGTDGAERLDVVRDRNGDVWLVWDDGAYGMYWRHSRVTATASAPRFDGSVERPVARWTLSEPAPGSYWTVWRAAGADEYEEVARLRAGPDLEVTWEDTATPLGEVLRYRLRRECVDRRYEAWGDEGAWWPRGPTLGLALRGAQPSAGEVDLVVAGAVAGALDLRAYDLQGRAVAQQRVWAGGSGEDRVRLALAGPGRMLPVSVYFVRVTDASGRQSKAVKAVVLR